MESDSPERLWMAWRGGDAGAFGRLYREISPGLYGFCRALTRLSGVDPDDLFQETFRRAIASAGRYRPGGSLAAWLATISRNAFLDQLRQIKVRSAPLAGAGPRSPDPFLASDVLDLLATLPEELREAIALRHLQGLAVSEVALILGVSEATVKRRIAEGFDLLSRKT